ncbi:hypothetical protein ABZ568_14055 [Streptomyces olindensis]|uniref:Uncharacterized protein n=1 Tax=Streptomyces olindensis TaxID=358823 RepID=A0ABV2XU40_9ACTN
MESDPVFTEPARRAILEAGSRACHSVPLTTASGLCVGMVSAHLYRPLRGLTTTQTEAPRYRGLHAQGRADRGSRLRRS